jgi:hypothetical protein
MARGIDGLIMKRLLSIAFLTVSAYGQVPAPDCIASFTLSTAGSSTGFPNQGCIFWNMTYRNYGFTGLSLTLQQAPDANNTPGVWKTFAGTGEVGSNPSTSITGAFYTIIASHTDLAAWARVTLSGTTGSGFVTGYAFGYKTYPGAAGSGGGGGGCTAPCVVIGPDAPGAASTQDPVQIAGNDGTDVRAIATDTLGRLNVVGTAAAGSAPAGNPVEASFQDAAGNNLIPQLCTLSAFFTTSASGNTLLVAASGATKIYLCHFVYQDVGIGNTVQVVQGTGATCAGSTANFGMSYVALAGAAQDYFLSPLVSAASNAICVNLANATQVNGEITYGQH